MVNFLEILYALAAGLTLAAVVLFVKKRRHAAIWCAWAAFAVALCAALLYVRLSPVNIALGPMVPATG